MQPLVGSTTQRRGWTMKARPGFGPDTTSTVNTGLGCSVGDHLAGVAVVPSDMRDGSGRSAWLGAAASGTRPTSTWRLTPSTFLAPPNPRGPATGDAFTLEESTTAAVSRLRRPERVRTSPRIAVSIRVQIPARDQHRKCSCAADQLTVKSWRRCAAHTGRRPGIRASVRTGRAARRADVSARRIGRP
jgi:hypothetical protein